MDVGARTHVGKVRSNNEDGFLIRDGLLAVADGMGGHQAGEVASETAMAVLRDYDFSGDSAAEQLRSAVHAAHARVVDLANRRADLNGMGTTLTAALIAPRSVHVAHVGDSRLYLWRPDALRLLTTDHSVAEELVRAGEIDAATARRHPGRHVLTRAIGATKQLDVDLATYETNDDDGFVLCTDGLSALVTDEEILQTVNEHTDVQQAADALVRLALRRGGDDNVTVIVARRQGVDR